ncbi:MAG: DUF2017 family protein [Micromonosporaceae bacterium]|nr:DUF2017 family protein [Micromonosporaceae bacterium]
MAYPGLFTRDGAECVATLRAAEATMLRRVFSEIAALVGEPMGSDPAIARLFPDAYRDDPEEAAEFRQLTEDDLRAAKVDQAGVVLATLPADGGEVRLDAEQAEDWLRALTDARLALGVRVEITDDTDLTDELDDAAMRDPTGARALQLSVYGYLTYLQESLVDALSEP